MWGGGGCGCGCVWVCVCVGLVTILIGEKFLPKDITKTKEKIDFSGFACIAIAIMTFFGGIFLGQESGFGSLQSYLLFIIAVIALGLFIMVERKRKSPLIKFAIFKNKIFTLSLLSAVLIFASNFFVNTCPLCEDKKYKRSNSFAVKFILLPSLSITIRV